MGRLSNAEKERRLNAQIEKLAKSPQLKNEITKMMERKVTKFARVIQNRMEDEYNSVISQFYAHYKPIVYDRTYSLYSSNKSSGIKGQLQINRIKEKRGGKYRIGIQFSSDDLPENTYKADNDYVFPRAFEMGIHGFCEDDVHDGWNRTVPPVMNPSPHEVLSNWFSEYVHSNELKETWKRI